MSSRQRTEISGFAALAELALDIRSSWNHAADDVWRKLDPALWELTHNPWSLLQTIARDRLEQILADLDPKSVRIELFADGVNGGGPARREMKRMRQLDGAEGGYVYSVAVPDARPTSDYTARLIPHDDNVAVPLENAHILWQR